MSQMAGELCNAAVEGHVVRPAGEGCRSGCVRSFGYSPPSTYCVQLLFYPRTPWFRELAVFTPGAIFRAPPLEVA